MYVTVQSVEAGVQEIDQYYRDLILLIAPPVNASVSRHLLML